MPNDVRMPECEQLVTVSCPASHRNATSLPCAAAHDPSRAQGSEALTAADRAPLMHLRCAMPRTATPSCDAQPMSDILSKSFDAHTGDGVLLLIPTYNERENLPRLVDAIRERLPLVQILVIDDNSPDGTGELADTIASRDERVRVLHRTKKEGLAAAYLAGFRSALASDAAVVFQMDADFSHDPRYLTPMLEGLLEADVCVGSRYVPGGGTAHWAWHRRWLSKGGGIYARTLLGIDVQDPTAGFVAFRRGALAHLVSQPIHANGYAFQIEVKARLIRAGFRLVEIPIVFPDRTRGQSKMTVDIAKEAVWQVLRLRRELGAPTAASPRTHEPD